MRRKVGLSLFIGLMLPLVGAANAFAQGAVLELTPSSGPPGTVVNVVGSGFNGSTATTAPGVQLRLSTRDAEPMKTATVSPQNTIADSFPIPNVPPGEYLVLGTQTSIRGAHLFGTPGRAKLRVTAGRAAAAAVPPDSSTSQATVAVGGGLVALILLAGATVALRRRTSHAPLGS
jgi:hypothetical protein